MIHCNYKILLVNERGIPVNITVAPGTTKDMIKEAMKRARDDYGMLKPSWRRIYPVDLENCGRIR